MISGWRLVPKEAGHGKQMFKRRWSYWGPHAKCRYEDMKVHLSLSLSLLFTRWFLSSGSNCKHNPVKLNASYRSHGLTYPGSTMDDKNGGVQACAWVIQSPDENDVITFQITDWFGAAQQHCAKDYVVIKDGSSLDSPNLRVVCGEVIFHGPVNSSSNAIYVYLNTYNDDDQRGFGLQYWSAHSNPVLTSMPVYGAVNYILIIVTVGVTCSFIGGVIYLYLREKSRERQVKQNKMKKMLQKRRKAISGPVYEDPFADRTDLDLETSKTDVTSFMGSSASPTSDCNV